MSNRYGHHKYTWTNLFGTVRHNWEFVCSKGGLNFHVSITPDYPASCGLEFHHVTPIHDNCAPDHLDCPVTGGRCWHDGTSIYANGHLWPTIQQLLQAGNHSCIFRVLEQDADSRFYPPEEKEETAVIERSVKVKAIYE